ncbi:Uncharacterized protein AC504_3415 [Pseudomonas syringae pv. maculicola]|nr:Uncharacterized protein AC504_3415 [Pseudomonas syringae pv. maculicola]
MAFFSGRFETEHLAHAGQKRFAGLFIDAHRPVALYVGMPTHRASPRTELADVAAQQQQVDDLLHGITATLVLSDAHPPAADDPLRALINRSHLFDGLARQARMALDGVPGQLSAIIGVLLKTMGVFFNERHIEDARQVFTLGHVVGFDHGLANALQGDHVAADSHLMVLRADLYAMKAEHVARVLRRRKAYQRPFPQRVERDDAGTPFCGRMQLGHHARAVASGVLTNDENRVGVLEIFQRRGALADPDRLGQRRSGGFMAHVRAVREVGHAVQPTEQLIQKGGFVRRAPGGVQLQLPRIAQAAQLCADLGERLVPGDGQVFVSGCVVAHRLGDTAFCFQLVIAPGRQFADRMPGEKLRRHAFFGRFPGQRFCTVLTVFKRVRFLWVRPGATGAIEAARLVHGQQRAVALDQHMLVQQVLVDRTERRPAARRCAVGL